MILQNNWRLGDIPHLGLMHHLNAIVRSIDIVNPHALPDFTGSATLTIGSDYSGQHSGSKYEAYAYVIADIAEAYEWELSRRKLREKYLPDGRRFSFKNLNDTKRAAALPEFLHAVDFIPGLLLVILVEKSIGTLFKKSQNEEFDSLCLDILDWPHHVQERLSRILNFNSFLISGLTHPGQNILWITDQDDIIANSEKHIKTTAAFGRILNHYLQHDLGHIRVASTASDTGKRDVEDFVSVADFAAGAVSEVLTAYSSSGNPIVRGVCMLPPGKVSEKTKILSNWFSADDVPLRRLVVSIAPVPGSQKLFLSHWKFEGLRVPIVR